MMMGCRCNCYNCNCTFNFKMCLLFVYYFDVIFDTIFESPFHLYLQKCHHFCTFVKIFSWKECQTMSYLGPSKKSRGKIASHQKMCAWNKIVEKFAVSRYWGKYVGVGFFKCSFYFEQLLYQISTYLVDTKCVPNLAPSFLKWVLL